MKYAQEFSSKYKNSKRIKFFLKGYSLIEVLISILIMTLLFGLGFANYRGYQKRKQLDNVVDMIKSDLSLARQSILAGKKPSGSVCNVPERILTGYLIFKVNNTSYDLKVECTDNVGGTHNTYTHTLKTVDLTSTGVTLADFTSAPDALVTANTITFYPAGKGTDLVSGSTATITIVHSLGNKYIYISSGGDFN